MGLEIKQVSKSYGDKMVVDHISFEIKEPGVFRITRF